MNETATETRPRSRWSRWWFAVAFLVIVIATMVFYIVPIYREQQAIAALEDRDFDLIIRPLLPESAKEYVDYRLNKAVRETILAAEEER